MEIVIGRKYLDTFKNEVVKITELTSEKNYVKVENKNYSRYTFTKHLENVCCCEACQKDEFLHNSDCAVHNEPALPNGKCSVLLMPHNGLR